MTLRQLRARLGQRHRLRPLPRRETEKGQELPSRDDLWRLDQSSGTSLELRNVSTGHVVHVKPETIRAFQPPDFLLLQCDIVIAGKTLRIEAHRPTARSRWRRRALIRKGQA
jgi:hypothetical protein